MAMNLVQHRGEPSVWDRTNTRAGWDAERWLAGAMAGALMAGGMRRRSPAGLMLVVGGGMLAWWAAAGIDERRQQRGRLRSVMPSPRRRAVDPVGEASEESFPASDAPSWTPSTGNMGPAQGARSH